MLFGIGNVTQASNLATDFPVIKYKPLQIN